MRVIGQPALPDLDPFLLFDEFGSDDPKAYLAGFPDHPHRGFETVTYMLAGKMRHFDSKGNEGLLGPGSVQWMTAGRGIIHSEMPMQENGLMRGFQLWINLPAKDKMCEPRYQDIAPDAIPELSLAEGVTAKILVGTLNGVSSPVNTGATEAFYFDLDFSALGKAVIPVPTQHRIFAYVYEGEIFLGPELHPLARRKIGIFSEGGELRLEAGRDGAKVIVIGGKPLDEPVAKHGPFVMNTQAEIRQAFADFQAGRF
jgi:redox-sensitive bicupin YhaK (pirin superfamily)